MDSRQDKQGIWGMTQYNSRGSIVYLFDSINWIQLHIQISVGVNSEI